MTMVTMAVQKTNTRAGRGARPASGPIARDIGPTAVADAVDIFNLPLTYGSQ